MRGESIQMAAIGIFRGPSHIFDEANEEMLALHAEDYRGMPYAEAFPDPTWTPFMDLMDEVYETGIALEVTMPAGVTWLVPLTLCGSVVGVAIHFSAVAPLPAGLPGAPGRRVLA